MTDIIRLARLKVRLWVSPVMLGDLSKEVPYETN